MDIDGWVPGGTGSRQLAVALPGAPEGESMDGGINFPPLPPELRAGAGNATSAGDSSISNRNRNRTMVDPAAAGIASRPFHVHDGTFS